jgi:hypothetical protein
MAEISGFKVTVRVECPRCSARYDQPLPPPSGIVPAALAVRVLRGLLATDHRQGRAGGGGVIVLASADLTSEADSRARG